LTNVEFTVEGGNKNLTHTLYQARLGEKTQNLYTFGSVIVESREATFLNASKAFYFDLTPIVFEIDLKEEFVYFLAHDGKDFILNRFSNEKQNLVNSMKNSDLNINNTDLFLNGNSVYFTASYSHEQTAAL
jgi:hypothetical protein